jgi:MFS family permease
MLLDLGPLRRHRNFRLLFAGQMVSFLGSMVSYVAVPYQIYELTRSSLLVGLISGVQLVPVLVFGLWGGSVADALDRRRLLILSEIVMSLGALALMLNALLPRPSVAAIFAVSFVMQAANAFHRPAMDALNQKLVALEEMAAVSALLSLRGSVGAVAGPALGGFLLARGGIAVAYGFDLATFLIALGCVYMLRDLPATEPSASPGLRGITEGLRYAWGRPELIGTYAIDIVAMTFAFPLALYPAMAEQWGGEEAIGWLYAAMSTGALLTSLMSGWTSRVRRHGAAVVYAAVFWGVFIVAFGFAKGLPMAFAMLALAGAADAVSGIFRMTIWNQTIPNTLRGRLAGVEMISYLSGPLLGNARAGAIASATSNELSIISGGVVCVFAVALCAAFLPKFWRYEPPAKAEGEASAAPPEVVKDGRAGKTSREG